MYAGTRLLVLWYEEQGMPFRIRTCINHWPDGMCQSGPVLFQIRRRRGRSGGRRGGMRKEEEEEGGRERKKRRQWRKGKKKRTSWRHMTGGYGSCMSRNGKGSCSG